MLKSDVYRIAWFLSFMMPVLFADAPDDDLLSYGVPPEWLRDVKAADEDKLLELADHPPAETRKRSLA